MYETRANFAQYLNKIFSGFNKNIMTFCFHLGPKSFGLQEFCSYLADIIKKLLGIAFIVASFKYLVMFIYMWLEL
jgi:hypothetical protein